MRDFPDILKTPNFFEHKFNSVVVLLPRTVSVEGAKCVVGRGTLKPMRRFVERANKMCFSTFACKSAGSVMFVISMASLFLDDGRV